MVMVTGGALERTVGAAEKAFHMGLYFSFAASELAKVGHVDLDAGLRPVGVGDLEQAKGVIFYSVVTVMQYLLFESGAIGYAVEAGEGRDSLPVGWREG